MKTTIRVIAFRTALLAWALGLLSALVGNTPLLLLGGALCVISLGAFGAAALKGRA